MFVILYNRLYTIYLLYTQPRWISPIHKHIQIQYKPYNMVIYIERLEPYCVGCANEVIPLHSNRLSAESCSDQFPSCVCYWHKFPLLLFRSLAFSHICSIWQHRKAHIFIFSTCRSSLGHFADSCRVLHRCDWLWNRSSLSSRRCTWRGLDCYTRI